ncbi:MAG: hypothetical protein RIB59_16550 [Rhodospirillales bacterium]
MFSIIDMSPNVTVTDKGGALTVSPAVRERVDAIWRDEKRKRGEALYNGRVFNLTEIGKSELSGFYVDYAYALAQHREPGLFSDLSLRPLAVCGIVSIKQGLIFGLRNENLTAHPGKWELAASGGVDDSVRGESGNVDYQEQFLNELCEELNLPSDAVGSMSTVALLEDSKTHVCDLVLDTRLSIGAETLFPLFNECGHEEYIAIDVIPESGVKGFVQLMKGVVTPESLHILSHKGYIKLMDSAG